MGKRGPKPKGQVKIKWSPEFAYALGLLVTDGYLSKDGRHISFVSKDEEQLLNLMMCLGILVKIGTTKSGQGDRTTTRIQFGDIVFYRYLLFLGITPAKTKTIGKVKIPNKYFFDFLRGHHDGDGYFYSYWDKRWKNSFMYYLEFISASKKHIDWIRKEIFKKLKIEGHITTGRGVYQLKYAKEEGFILLKRLYYNKGVISLKRKRLKIEDALAIVGKHL